MCQNDSICIFLTDFFLIRKKFGAVYRVQNLKLSFRYEISDKKTPFSSIITASSEIKSPNFSFFTFFRWLA